jgi:hypothetical protein
MEPKPIIDPFGQNRDTVTGDVIPPKVPEVEPTKKEGETEKPVVDIKEDPAFKALQTELEKSNTDKASMGKSLSDQRKEIDDMKKQLNGEKKGEAKPVFADIKHVKDLPKEEQDEMSETEKKLFDQNATLMEKFNEQAKSEVSAKDAADAEAKAAADIAERTDAMNKSVQTQAMKLAGNDSGMANEIIKNFNMFAGNLELDDKALTERLASAARMIPTYTPPKEQGSGGTGGAIKDGAKNDDPHDVEKVIKQVLDQRNKPGQYTY